METINEAGEKEVYIDLKPYVLRVIHSWKRILVWALCGALVGIVIGISTPRTFTSTTIVAPEIATRSTLGSGVSSLASLAGINMNTLAMTDAMHPDLYAEVIKSADMAISLFDLPVTVQTRDSLVCTDLYDYMVNYTRQPWWNYIMGLPRMGVAAIKSIFVKSDTPEDSEGPALVDSLRLTRQQERVIKALRKSITATVEKKTYVLSIRTVMQDRVVAAQVANAVVEKLRQFVVDYRRERALDNVDYLQQIYEETHTDYLAAQRKYAYYVDSHLGSLSRSSQVEQQHLQNEAQARYQIYYQTAQNLLAARVKVQQEAPVLLVIQSAKAPVTGKPSRVRLMFIWLILGALAGTCMAALRKEKCGGGAA